MTHDNDLKAAVLEELAWEPSVSAAHIGVAAHNGVVTLTGHVERFSEKQAAETAVRRVKGVLAVAEALEVKLPFDVKRSDEDIALAAIDRLAWDTSVPDDAVKVTVEKGWITLTGEVAWNFERVAVEHDVRRLWGVTGVSNHIAIKTRVNLSTLAAQIDHALHRSWLDPERVGVTASGGRVKLTGSVDSASHRELAASIAWGAPGATFVDNELVIS